MIRALWMVVGAALALAAGVLLWRAKEVPRATSPPYVDLLPQVVHARLERPAPTLPPELRLEAAAGGLATVSVELSAATRRSVPGGAREAVELTLWELPLPPAPELLAGGRGPRLEPERPLVTHAGADVDPAHGFFFVGSQEEGPVLLVGSPAADPLRGPVRLSYPVQAARLAGSELAREQPVEALVAGRSVQGPRSAEALVVAGGGRLRLPLPAWGEPRRLEARLHCEGPCERVRLAVELGDGGLVWTWEWPRAGSEGGRVRIELPPAPAGGWLELAVEGAPEALAFLEEPRLSRLRVPADPPDALLVVIDTLRADRLGAYGSTRGLTPTLDRLAERSLVFTDCWATSSWTLPSMATLLTSNHGGQHQAWLNDRTLGPELDTLPELFRRAGYRTAAFTGGVFVEQTFGLDRGFATFDSGGDGFGEVLGGAREWLEDAGEGPWFLMVHTYEVHAPYQPPPEALERVLASHDDLLAGRTPEPQAFYEDMGSEDGRGERIAALLADLYDEEVRHADRLLGSFLEELEAEGHLEDALVAVTSDHGEEFGEHGLLGHTDTLYAEQLRVPLLLRLPGGRRAGERDARPVSQIDFAATFADAAGLGGELSRSTFVGRTLLGEAPPSPIYATRFLEEVGLLRAMRRDRRALVDGPYLHPRAARGPELYRLDEDPGQLANRFAEDARAAELLRELEALSAVFDEPRSSPSRVESPRVRDLLQDMGYAGEAD